MDRLKEAKEALARVLGQIKGVAGAAEAQRRDLNGEEQTQVKALMGEAHRLKDRVVKLEAEADLMAQIAEIGNTVGTPVGSRPDPAIAGAGRRFAAGRPPEAKAWSDAFVGQFGFKGLTLPSGALVVPAPTTGIAQMGQPAQFVADLIPSQPVTGSSQPYFRQSVRTNQAGVVAPSGQKPESDYGIVRPEAKIVTVAHIVDGVHRNDLADAASLEQFIQDEMFLGLRIATDDELLNGDGTGDHLEGLLHVSGVQSQTFATSKIVTLRKSVTKLQLVYMVASGAVVHPNDAEALDLATDDTGRFYFMGPRASGASPVWSVPVAVTPAIDEGVALMCDFASSAVIFQREDARLDFTEALGFKTNQVTFRAELRMGLGILRPNAFVVVDLTA